MYADLIGNYKEPEIKSLGRNPVEMQGENDMVR